MVAIPKKSSECGGAVLRILAEHLKDVRNHHLLFIASHEMAPFRRFATACKAMAEIVREIVRMRRRLAETTVRDMATEMNELRPANPAERPEYYVRIHPGELEARYSVKAPARHVELIHRVEGSLRKVHVTHRWIRVYMDPADFQVHIFVRDTSITSPPRAEDHVTLSVSVDKHGHPKYYIGSNSEGRIGGYLFEESASELAYLIRSGTVPPWYLFEEPASELAYLMRSGMLRLDR